MRIYPAVWVLGEQESETEQDGAGPQKEVCWPIKFADLFAEGEVLQLSRWRVV